MDRQVLENREIVKLFVDQSILFNGHFDQMKPRYSPPNSVAEKVGKIM